MTQTNANFLDVVGSATGRRWIERLGPREQRVASELSQKLGLKDIEARILAARGIDVAGASSHLEPSLRTTMPDPSTITDVDQAAERIADAVTRRQRVAIFGDYDVDGASSSALLVRYFAFFGVDTTVYIPDRVFEGYGPNRPAIAELARDHDLIVCVDCGTNSADALKAADGTGADCLVIDHHQVGGPLPEIVAVVNPNRDDDLSGLGTLCAAGVAFMVLVAVNRVLRARHIGAVPDLLAMLDIVALATVCDVVALTGLNRTFVKQGLQVAHQRKNAGLRALVDVSRLSGPLRAHHFGFMLGPRINAGGRIGDASMGARLLSVDDPDEAAKLASQLDTLNAERQAIEAAMVEEAKAMADRELRSSNPPSVLVLASRDWHVGIVGLIASRVKDAFNRPTFAIALRDNDTGTGSARSVPGLDIGALVRAAVAEGLLQKGGGHAMAAGITTQTDKIAALRAFFEDRAAATVNNLVENRTLKIDAALSARGLNGNLLDMLERVGPFGTDYPSPLFALPHHTITDCRIVGTGHLRVSLKAMDGATCEAMAFGAVDTDLGIFLQREALGRRVHIAGTVAPNTWRGETRAQLRIIDVARAAE